MKTKIVYVVASVDEDVYMEQAIVSAWSVRHYNPDCRIEMVCDQDTYTTCMFGIRAQYRSLFDEIHVREFKSDQCMKERSRWMKTTLREIIKGDYLYLDTDTVVCADLSYIDDFGFDLGMVLDCNCEFSHTLVYDWVVPTMQRIYGMDVSKERIYYNSGVAFVRDSQLAREFYKYWNEQWVYSLRQFGIMQDQQPLLKTNHDMGYVVTEMSGDLNCLVVESIQYLHTAHIVHFANHLLGKDDGLSPFYKNLFLEVKQYGLTDKIKETIMNCKSSFCSPSMPVSREAAVFWRNYLSSQNTRKFEEKIKSSNSYYTISCLWRRYPRLMRAVEMILGFFIRLYKRLKPRNGRL